MVVELDELQTLLECLERAFPLFVGGHGDLPPSGSASPAGLSVVQAIGERKAPGPSARCGRGREELRDRGAKPGPVLNVGQMSDASQDA